MRTARKLCQKLGVTDVLVTKGARVVVVDDELGAATVTDGGGSLLPPVVGAETRVGTGEPPDPSCVINT